MARLPGASESYWQFLLIITPDFVHGGSQKSVLANEVAMLTVYNCLVTEHDLRLVALAAVICALASYTAISLLHYVRKSAADMWRVWLAVSAMSTGFGIWRRTSSPCWLSRPAFPL